MTCLRFLLLIAIAGLFALKSNDLLADTPKPNVLLVMFDDLRGDYADIGAKTPNLDQIASQGVTFRRAYAAIPSCGASRCSIFSGLHPTRSRYLHYRSRVDQDTPDAVTLADRFKSAGYTTVSNGKVYHEPEDDSNGWTNDPRFRPTGKSWWPGQRAGEPAHFRFWQNNSPKNRRTGRGPAYERGVGVSDSFYGEGVLVDKSIEDLKLLTAEQQPFFMAVGFHRPHLPFVAPDRYWDMYSSEEMQRLNQQIERNRSRAAGVNRRFYHPWSELRAYGGVPQKLEEIRQDQQLEQTLVHAYLAAVSYSDAQLGRMLAALRDPNGDGNQADSVWDNTVVVIVSDHGFHLGENDIWAKACLWDIALHSALMIKPLPSQQAAVGQSSRALVSLLDVYPTMCDLLGHDHPPEIVGDSLWPLVASPDVHGDRAVISRFRTGDSLRTPTHRYTEHTDKSGKVLARSLFDLNSDPHQTTNLVKEQPQLVAEMRQRLSQGWRPTPPRSESP